MLICSRCGYRTNVKQNIEKHIIRVNMCSPILKDIKPKIKIISKLTCLFCLKDFSRNDSLKRHQKSCKKKNETDKEKFEEKTKDELLEIIQIQKKQLEKRTVIDNSVNNVVNVVNNIDNRVTNNTINITILAYPDADLSHLTDDKIQEYLVGDPVQNIPKLIEYIHCNPEKPENHNIFINNRSLDDISVWDGKEVVSRNKKKIIQDVIDKSSDHFEKLAEIKNKKQYEKYIVKRGNEEYDIEDKIEDEVKKSLNKHKTMIKKTIKENT